MTDAISPLFESMRPDDPTLAAQLRKPEGELGSRVAGGMNISNVFVTEMTYGLMDLKPSDTILEIGFGNGKFLPMLTERVHLVVGIDFSEDMVREAAENNVTAIATGRLELQQASISSIPFPDSTFDKVCTINTLYFWPDPLNDLAEVKRVMKPGGSLYLGIRTKETLGQMTFTAYGFKLYEFDELRKLLESAGFTNVTSDRRIEPLPPFEAMVVMAVAP
jgi:SAM-dependent methyltransferase